MKYCVSARQSSEVLGQADEIRLPYKDIGLFFDLLEKFPEKTFIIEMRSDDEIDWGQLKVPGKVVAACPTAKMMAEATFHEIAAFWNYPVTTYYELDGVMNLNPAYILLGPPLSFDLPKVVSKVGETPLRLVANLAYDAYLPHVNGINGQWVRPEDVQYYEPYIDVMEFIAPDLGREAALLKIYKEKSWAGNLNLLFINFNYNVDNRLLPKDIGERRVKCGQRCMSDDTCHYCFNTIQFATSIRKEHFNDSSIFTK